MDTTKMSVMDFMKPAKTITRDTEISAALRMLSESGAGVLSVVDDEHFLIGAITENNFIRLVRHTPSSPLEEPTWYDSIESEDGKKPVEKIMTTNITTLSPNDDIKTALKIMNSVGYRFAHVVSDERKLLGMIWLKDIFIKVFGE
ncbi:MAG: CBS domain-containing protein [Candidatus Aenigmarchaeota archaeon]|nr:CBS domain-containing protein [Candidatus Aenigmarchaeota archaeon]